MEGMHSPQPSADWQAARSSASETAWDRILCPLHGQIGLFEDVTEYRSLGPAMTSEQEGDPFQVEEGVTLVRSPEGLSLEVKGYGVKLSRKSERLAIKKAGGKMLWQAPLTAFSDILIHGEGVSLSGSLLTALAGAGVRVVIFGPSRRPEALLQSAVLLGSEGPHRGQLKHHDGPAGLMLARRLAAGKVKNQAHLLKYIAKGLGGESKLLVSAKAIDMLKLGSAIRRHPWRDIARARPAIMGLEGTAGRLYWQAVQELLKDRAPFPGRKTRGARDIVNGCLNYGYSLLYSQVWGAVAAAGLNPFIGVLHAERSGKPSLVLDLVEEFRAPVVDRTVLSLFRLGTLRDAPDGPLSPTVRQAVAQAVLERFDAKVDFQGRKPMMRSVIQSQARQVAAVFAGKRQDYKPYSFRY